LTDVEKWLAWVENKLVIERGWYNGIEAYQDCWKDEGAIYKASNSDYITSDYLGSLDKPSGRLTTIVLTIAHLDHDIRNNSMENLKALCQKCHLNYDKHYHRKNASQTIKNKKGIIEFSFVAKN
jgi:5-methylcytosine-specific restriction endonuclease McrA